MDNEDPRNQMSTDKFIASVDGYQKANEFRLKGGKQPSNLRSSNRRVEPYKIPHRIGATRMT